MKAEFDADAGPAPEEIMLGIGRCFGDNDALYAAYHDTEWARPTHDETELFERLCLEAFQSGLSWLTILRKRENFRRAFAGFDPELVAAFTDRDVARLLADAGIVRNRAKIMAVIGNARALTALHHSGGTLADLMWSHAPAARTAAPASPAEIPATTPESTALARALKRAGFAFVGPTTAYAAMQACGLVNDHVASCPSCPDR